MPIGLVSAGVVAAGAIGGAVISSNAAKSAAKTQAAAADSATALQRDIYNQNRTDSAPWRETGGNALQMLANSLGLNGQSGNDTANAAFQKSPGYDFAFSEGSRAVDQSAAAKGMLRSGADIKEQTRFGQGQANQEYGGWLNKLGVLAGVGQTANAQQAQGATAYANNTGNLMQDAAASRASGYVGSSNAWSGGINNLARLAGNYGGNASGYSNAGGGNYNGNYLAPFGSAAAAQGF